MKKFNNKVLFLICSLVIGAASGNASELYTGVGNFDPAFIDQTNLMNMRQFEEKRQFIKDHYKDKDQIEREQKLDEDLKKKLEENPVPQTSFILNSIAIENNTVYKTPVLMRLIDEHIGKEVTIEDLIMMANQITEYYQNNGYLSTVAYLPPQKVQDGNIRIVVLEGRYGKINIEGNKWTRSRFLKKQFLEDNKIKEGEILNVKDIKTVLKDLNSQNYIKAGISMYDAEAGEEFSDITLEVKDRFPIDFDFRWDNQGRELTGLQRAVFYAGMYNLTGFGDQLLSTTTLSARAWGESLMYTVPIAKNETKLTLGWSYSASNLGGEFKEFGIKGKSTNYFVNLSRRLIKKDTYKLYGDIALDIRDSTTTSNVEGLYSQYKTRAVRANLTNVKDDMYGKWMFNVGASAGVPLLGATNTTNDRDVAGNNFVKLNANLARLQLLPWNSLGIFQLAGQASTRALFPSEKMYLGGIASVRGYEEGFVLADNAFTGSIEVRTPVPFLGRILPEKLKFIDDSIRLAAFYDFGWFCNTASEDPASYLMSLGFGTVVKLSKYVSGNFYVGIPVGKKIEGASNARFHFAIASNIL